jgi:D-alanyl-D-alanine carboxypeptidase/D-alanyl-D-alanine-endopeptidase (penicillin-binding protein 4)
VNDHGGRTAETVRAVDALGAAIAAAGVPAATPGDPPALAGDDAGGRVAAYYRLGLAGDRRNLTFLRTALRTETDVAARMAVAEAVYLSDPFGDGARRAFLEAVAADPAAIDRLRALARGLVATPVVDSLGDLAAEGVAEALFRLAELSAAGMGPALAPVWDEVAALAPGETAAFLLSAPRPLSDAAASSLALGLGREGRRSETHPLLAELARAAQGEGVAGAEGRALDARVRDWIAAARAPSDGPGSPPAPPAPGDAPPVPASPSLSSPSTADASPPTAIPGPAVEIGGRAGGG